MEGLGEMGFRDWELGVGNLPAGRQVRSWEFGFWILGIWIFVRC